jgi:hypothetical protein
MALYANAPPVKTEIPSPAVPAQSTNARIKDLVNRHKYVFKVVVSISVRELFAVLVPCVIRPRVNVFVKRISLAIPILFVCRQSQVLVVCQIVAIMHTASMARSLIIVFVMWASLEILTLDVHRRKSNHARKAVAVKMHNANLDRHLRSVFASQDSPEILTSNVMTLTSARLKFVPKMRFALIQPAHLTANVCLDILAIPSFYVRQCRRAFVRIQTTANAVLNLFAHLVIFVMAIDAKIFARKRNAVHSQLAIQRLVNARACKAIKVMQKTCPPDVHSLDSAIWIKTAKIQKFASKTEEVYENVCKDA